MDWEKRSVVSEECHRLQAELRLTSQKNLIPELRDELRSLRFLIWSCETCPPLKVIISPFQKMIEQPRSTDVITHVAVNALSEFLNVGLFTCEADVSALVQCLCSCQYQITSEADCLALTIQMRNMFLKLFRHTGYESILEGEVTETGVGFVIRKRVLKISDLFRVVRERVRKNEAENQNGER